MSFMIVLKIPAADCRNPRAKFVNFFDHYTNFQMEGNE